MSLSKATALDQPLSCLFEDPGLPAYRIPQALIELYGGSIGFPEPCLYANFVASIDGIVALEQRESSGTVISGGSPADHFVMGLLRACAEAVVVAGGTFRATPNHRWTARHIFPALADEFERMRRDLQRPAEPTLVVVSARGDVDMRHPALEGPALVLTTREGEARLRGRVPKSCKVLPLPEGKPTVRSVMDAVRAEGFSTVLTEGGPSFLGQLVAEQLLDELFLTVAPRLVGRAGEGSRKSLIAGADVLGRAGAEARLLSLRMHRSYLFLRYRLGEVDGHE
jgi:riboflavin biosynthesis pyrimidine reductase